MTTRSAALTVGCHVASTTVWLGASDEHGRLVELDQDRFALNEQSLGEARAVAELAESLTVFLRKHAVQRVVLLDAGTSRRKPAPSNSRRRGHLEGAVMIASTRADVDFVRVTHKAVKKVVGLSPTDDGLGDHLMGRLAGDRPSKWADRSKALAAAVAIVEGA